MKILGNPNDRCITYFDKCIVVKKYISIESFNNEKYVYEALGNKKYLPKLISIDDNNKKICMEYLGENSLENYLKTNPLPKGFFIKLYRILIDMLDKKIYDGCEHSIRGKFLEHTFICENEIKIIDFDTSERISDKTPINVFKNLINEDFAFLFERTEVNFNNLRQKLYINGFDKVSVDKLLEEYK